MLRSQKPTESLILNAAYELIHKKGFYKVGVDEIAEAAGITKRTLYYHFASKDALLEAVLSTHSELALARIKKYEDRYSGSAGEIIDVLFSELAKWSKKPGWTGAGFTRLVMELADLPGHPALVIARRHKAALEEWWESLLKRAGVPSPLTGAREVMLLMEGAIALTLIHRDQRYAEVACQAAKKLVNGLRRS